MAEGLFCRSPYHEEYIQTSASGNPEGVRPLYRQQRRVQHQGRHDLPTHHEPIFGAFGKPHLQRHRPYAPCHPQHHAQHHQDRIGQDGQGNEDT